MYQSYSICSRELMAYVQQKNFLKKTKESLMFRISSYYVRRHRSQTKCLARPAFVDVRDENNG